MDPPGGFPSLTKTWHNKSYASIDPTQPHLSVAEKKIIITGGGSGIGLAIASSYAAAEAASVAILGRRQNVLEASKAELEKKHPNTKFIALQADVTDEPSITKAAETLGGWDILILNAGYLPELGPSAGHQNLADWWLAYEINTKGIALSTKAFLPTKGPSPIIIATNTLAVALPVKMMPGNSGYVTSKLAAAKLVEYIAAEYPELHIVNFHPGSVETDMYYKAGMSGVPMDDVQLSGDYSVWLASSEASFLRGKFASVNWDVNELKSRAKEIQETDLLSTTVLGWGGHP